MPELEIVNVVATADMHQQVDLIQISQLDYTIYGPEKYGGRCAYLKTPEMHGKVSIFLSGKLISVGSKSPEQAQRDLKRTTEILVSNGLIDHTARARENYFWKQAREINDNLFRADVDFSSVFHLLQHRFHIFPLYIQKLRDEIVY